MQLLLSFHFSIGSRDQTRARLYRKHLHSLGSSLAHTILEFLIKNYLFALGGMHSALYLGVREQTLGAVSHLLLCGSWGLNSDRHTWQEAP